MPSWLYSCNVFHKRFAPRAYGFTSRLFMWHLDLEEIDGICRKLPILSHNRFNVYAFRDDDHLHMGRNSLRANVEAYLRENGVTEPAGRISLLTNLRTFGYVFNPVSFFFCHDRSGEPLAVIVEVHNTFGELKPFLLRRQDLESNRFRKTFPKRFYISPFSGLDKQLEIKVDLPGERLAIHVNSYENGASKPFFRSSLTGRRQPLTLPSLIGYSLRFPLVTLRVISLIHWHALKLYLMKVPFHRKSENRHLQTGILPKKHQRTLS
ncbi:MAG: DUF1365 domain-containing protein [Oceanipulchritudo sp.]|jgi:DUF1365 family protein